MKTLILTLLIALTAKAETANYFRFWQGYKKHSITHSQFMAGLPSFMKLTVDTYGGKGLVNYVVPVPPEKRPAFIPDEFALVAFDSKESYDKVRATSEGKAYGDAHWDYFDRYISKSAEMKTLTEDVKELEWNVAYNVLGEGIPLNNTHITFFIGLRKSGVSSEVFREKMLKHLRFVAGKLQPLGMKGYLALARKNYEVAYLVWESKEKSDQAFASEAGKEVVQDAESILTTLMFSEAKLFNGEVSYESVNKALE